jgi:hypothetical protein
MSQRSTKVQKDVSKSTANKLVVICVDRDDDVGEKTGITTPSSLSTQITTNLLTVDLLTSFCTLVDLCDIVIHNIQLVFNDFQHF